MMFKLISGHPNIQPCCFDSTLGIYDLQRELKSVLNVYYGRASIGNHSFFWNFRMCLSVLLVTSFFKDLRISPSTEEAIDFQSQILSSYESIAGEGN